MNDLTRRGQSGTVAPCPRCGMDLPITDLMTLAIHISVFHEDIWPKFEKYLQRMSEWADAHKGASTQDAAVAAGKVMDELELSLRPTRRA